MREPERRYDWEKLLAHAAILQAKVPSAVLVGGTAAALHAGHRISFDHDHVLKDLTRHYDEASAALESIVGWRTKRRIRAKLVPGEIDGIDAGLRNQRRSAPLETTTVKAPGGRILKVPTIEEMLRIKAFLLVERNATRDYLDVAALSHHLGRVKSVLNGREYEAVVRRVRGRSRRHPHLHRCEAGHARPVRSHRGRPERVQGHHRPLERLERGQATVSLPGCRDCWGSFLPARQGSATSGSSLPRKTAGLLLEVRRFRYRKRLLARPG